MSTLPPHRPVLPPNVPPEFALWMDQLKRYVEGASFPVGVMQAYAGATAPTGWLLCSGQAVQKTLYPDLYSVLKDAYGETTDTFTLPDCRDKALIGASTAALHATVGANDLTLTVDQIPTHNHTVTDAGHTHGVTDPGHAHTSLEIEATTGNVTSGANNNIIAGNTGSATTGISIDTATTGITLADTGGGQSFDNRQLSLAVNVIIKT